MKKVVGIAFVWAISIVVSLYAVFLTKVSDL